MGQQLELLQAYTKEEVMNLIGGAALSQNLGEEVSIVSGLVYFFIQVAIDGNGSHFPIPSDFTWDHDRAGISPATVSSIISQVTPPAFGRLFVRLPTDKMFIYLGRVQYTRRGISIFEERVGKNLSLIEIKYLPKDLWVAFGGHAGWTLRIESPNAEPQSIRLQLGQDLEPLLQQLTACPDPQYLTVSRWERDLFEALINGDDACLVVNCDVHSYNPTYGGRDDRTVPFYCLGELAEVSVHSVISKTSALEAMKVFIETDQLVDFIQWEVGERP